MQEGADAYLLKPFDVLNSHGFIQSMSRKGNCYDNAVAESFFHTLRQSMCMTTGMKQGQMPDRVFSIILKYSIIVKDGTQLWDIVPRYHLSWRLW